MIRGLSGLLLLLLTLVGCGRGGPGSTGSILWEVDAATGFYRGPANSSLWINGAADGGSCVMFPEGLFKDMGSGANRVQGAQCGEYTIQRDGNTFDDRVTLFPGFDVRGLTLAFDLPSAWNRYCTDAASITPINTSQPGPWASCGMLPNDAIAGVSGQGERLVGLKVCGASYLEHSNGTSTIRRTLLGGFGSCQVYLFNGLSYTSEVGWFQALGNAPLVPAGTYTGRETFTLR